MEFADSADDKETPAADAGVTRVEPPAVSDTFASWYQSPPPGAANDAGSTHLPTQTVNATSAQAPGSGFTAGNPFSAANPVTPPGPPAPFPPLPPPAGRPPAGPPANGGRRWLFMAIAVIVVLAAGGGAYALATKLGKHSTGQPSAGGSTQTGSSSAPASPTGGTSQASSPSASASATPSPTLSLVAVAPGVSTSAPEPQVETLLSHYFHGINTHSYAEYAATLSSVEQAKQSQAQFDSGYSSTTDSAMALTSLSTTGGGGLTATVTFTSHQSPAQSIDKSACNTWTLNLYLVQQGGGYLIRPAPSGYQPTYADC